MRNRKNKGFTLIEMLVVIAVIAILVAVVIPTVSNATEKSREATDLANVRAAYAKVVYAALSEDPSEVEYSDEIGYYLDVDLKQKDDSWVMDPEENTLSVGGISIQDHDRWLNRPAATCRVYFRDDEAYLDWGGEGRGASYTKAPLSGLSLKNLGSGYLNSSNMGTPTNEIEKQQQEMVRQLKEYLGWDEITVSFGNNGTYKNGYLVSAIEGTYSATGSVNTSSEQTKRFFIDKNTGEIIAVWEQPGSWGVNGNGQVGFWGSSGNQTVIYECENINKYR